MEYLLSKVPAFLNIRPDQFNFQEHGFFPKFEGSVRKKETKKKSPIFCIGFDYQ